ncbi:MAG: cell division protein FtsK, partial [Pseudonocardiaceae bacterium]
PWALGVPVRRPVISPWLRDRRQAVQAARWVASIGWHWGAFHTVRLPLYALRMLLLAPRGAVRVAARVAGWVTDAETAPLRSAAVIRQDIEAYLKLARQRADLTRPRRAAAGLAALGLAAGVLLAGWLAPGWAQLLAAVAAVVALAHAGRPLDRPWIGAAVQVPKVPVLTSELVLRALRSTGLPALTAKDARITFPAPIARDGPGWRAEVELPYGATAADVMDKRERVASGLRRPLGCVWPEPVNEEHPGRLVLFVGDAVMRKAKQPPWPLAKTGTTDLFQPQPFATDVRGGWVNLPFVFTSGAIGAVPRVGKTFALREILLIAALDPRAQIHAYDLKGTGDLSPLEPVAHRYAAGDEPEAIDYGIEAIRELQQEMRRRIKVINGLPRSECPEFKVTPELADKRSLGLFPIVVGVDECQVWFEHPTYGGEFEAIVTDLVKRGPAVGIIFWVATQRPDNKSLPSGISDNVVVRFCLKVRGHTANNMVLGTGAYAEGVRATLFKLDDKGIGYLDAGGDPQIVKTVYLDGDASDAIVARARGYRDKAGTLTGYALGETPAPTPAATLLDDLAVVYAASVRTDRPGAWSETLCELLADHRPELYAGWDADALAAALRPLGVETRQIAMTVDGERFNRRGVRREDLDAAVAARAERKGIDQ